MTTWPRPLLAALLVSASAVAVQAAPQDTKKPEAATADTKKPEPPREKAFAELITDAKTFTGLFTLYQTEEKVYLEIQPDQFDRMYMISVTCESGIGERGFYAAQMCGELPIQFQKQAKNVQLVAKNTQFVAADTTAFHRAIDGRSATRSSA